MICKQNDECIFLSYMDVDLWLRVTRAFCLLAVVASAIAVAIIILVVKTKLVRGYVCALLFFMSSVFILIALVVFAAEISAPGIDYNFGWSYALGWIGMIFGILPGVIILRY